MPPVRQTFRQPGHRRGSATPTHRSSPQRGRFLEPKSKEKAVERANESSMRNPLPDLWVARIFQAMQGNYGTRFLNQWKTGQTLPDGTDAGVKNAMAFWADKLGGFSDQPERIKRVLDSLPTDPPSLPQFVELCRMARSDDKPALPHKPTAEEAEHQRDMAKRLGDAIGAGKMRDGIDEHWATHPRSAMQLGMIFDAAKRDPRFQPCIDQMVADGICTEGGVLLKAYRGCNSWETLRRAA